MDDTLRRPRAMTNPDKTHATVQPFGPGRPKNFPGRPARSEAEDDAVPKPRVLYKNKRIGVVVPAYNEGTQIAKVITTMPEYVDRIYVVDDRSSDNTVAVVKEFAEKEPHRVVLIEHEVNQGVGGAIATGYKRARDERIDVVAVMAGDAQMAPNELPDVIEPVIDGECDYAKGNRLFTGDAWKIIPRVRYLGNSMLSLLTKIATGYWHVADSQCGYTAISLKALQTIDWDKMYKRYGQPNDLLARLNIYSFRVRDVVVSPVYNVGEKSGIKPIRMIPRLSFLLFRLFVFRMVQKYLIRDFHPLLFFYFTGFVLLLAGGALGGKLLANRVLYGPVAGTSALFAVFLVITAVQFLLFGMWMDMESNRKLK